jgi:hypothetical protein
MAETPTKELPPFTPPTQKHIDENLKPEDAEAKDLAEKVLRQKVSPPVGFTVNHDGVGPWTKGQRLSVQQVRAQLGGQSHRITDEDEQDACIQRLIELNALVPHFE